MYYPGALVASITAIMYRQGGVPVRNANLCRKCSTPLRYESKRVAVVVMMIMIRLHL
jgi:hypothetical protein